MKSTTATDISHSEVYAKTSRYEAETVYYIPLNPNLR